MELYQVIQTRDGNLYVAPPATPGSGWGDVEFVDMAYELYTTRFLRFTKDDGEEVEEFSGEHLYFVVYKSTLDNKFYVTLSSELIWDGESEPVIKTTGSIYMISHMTNIDPKKLKSLIKSKEVEL